MLSPGDQATAWGDMWMPRVSNVLKTGVQQAMHAHFMEEQ